MKDRQRDIYGARYIPEYQEQRFIDTVENQDISTPAEIAKLLGCSLSLAQKNLQALYKAGKIAGSFKAGRWLYSKRKNAPD